MAKRPRPIHTLQVALKQKRLNSFEHRIISVHAADRFRERLSYLRKYFIRYSTEATVEEFETVYSDFIGVHFYDNLASLFNMAVEIPLDEDMIHRNSKYDVDVSVRNISIYNFIMVGGVVNTIEFNGHFRRANIPFN